jgi:hypothetical protein
MTRLPSTGTGCKNKVTIGKKLAYPSTNPFYHTGAPGGTATAEFSFFCSTLFHGGNIIGLRRQNVAAALRLTFWPSQDRNEGVPPDRHFPGLRR